MLPPASARQRLSTPKRAPARFDTFRHLKSNQTSALRSESPCRLTRYDPVVTAGRGLALRTATFGLAQFTCNPANSSLRYRAPL